MRSTKRKALMLQGIFKADREQRRQTFEPKTKAFEIMRRTAGGRYLFHKQHGGRS